MLLIEFEKVLAADENLAKKFEALKEEKFKTVNSDKDAFLALAEAAKELGYDIDESELTFESIMAKEISQEELEKVSGGDEGWCMFNYECYGITRHPKEQNKNTACWSDYECIYFYENA